MSTIDSTSETDIVVPNSGQAPAAATTGGSAPPPTETPNGEAPAEPEAKAPDWFVTETSKLRRQRTESERRAMRLEAEVAELRKAVQQPQAKSADLRPSDFPNYDEFVKATIKQTVATETDEKLRATVGSSAEREATRAAQANYEAFMANAAENAETAGVNLTAVMRTLARQPLFPQEIFNLVAESDQPARLAQYLAKNPDELSRVSRMDSELAEETLTEIQASLPKLKPRSNATNAPPPVPTVGGRGASQLDPEKIDDMEQYKAYWQARRDGKR